MFWKRTSPCTVHLTGVIGMHKPLLAGTSIRHFEAQSSLLTCIGLFFFAIFFSFWGAEKTSACTICTVQSRFSLQRFNTESNSSIRKNRKRKVKNGNLLRRSGNGYTKFLKFLAFVGLTFSEGLDTPETSYGFRGNPENPWKSLRIPKDFSGIPKNP